MTIDTLRMLWGYLTYEPAMNSWIYKLKILYRGEIKEILLAYLPEDRLEEIMEEYNLKIRDVEEALKKYFDISMRDISILLNNDRLSKSTIRESITGRRRPYKFKKSKIEKVVKNYLEEHLGSLI